MKIVFPCDPTNDSVVDSMYLDEVAAATRAGLDYIMIDYEAIRQQNAARAVRDVPVHEEPIAAVYRGWMLSAEQYRLLHDALLSRGINLINDSRHYKNVHHLPESLSILKPYTPRTVYLATDGKFISYPAIMQSLLQFAGQALILKDYVKSEKHYWEQACYIASASDETEVTNTIKRFLELRGADFEGGLVFREFVELQPLTEHPASGMPLSKEFRIFYLKGVPIMTVRYWDIEGYDEEDYPPAGIFNDVAKQVGSNFFTMDVAQRTDGEWIIIELGDAQVAGLPKTADEDLLYKALAGAH